MHLETLMLSFLIDIYQTEGAPCKNALHKPRVLACWTSGYSVDRCLSKHVEKKGSPKMRRRGVVVVLLMGWLFMEALAYAIPGSSKYQQRAAAFGMGAVSGASSPVGRVLEPVGTNVSDHPLFQSLYIGEPDRTVAETRYGKVTARDLYLFLVLCRSEIPPNILEQYDKEQTPEERKKLTEKVRKAVDDYVFVNFVVPRLTARLPWTEVDESRAMIAAHEAYRFVYVANVVRSKIHISDADRVKYLQEHRSELAAPERWRIRYIFLRSEETDPLDQQDAVQKRLEDIRQDILRGKIEFPEAARQYSEAPSAAHGGEIPPFRRGELFFYLEDAVTNLRPGEVTEVIRGPHGFYLAQLIETLPPEELSLDNPVQAGKVEEGLTRQVMRAQYLWDLKVLLQEKRRPVYDLRPWDEKQADQVVGQVGEFRLTKGQLLNIFPSLESEDLANLESFVERTVRQILESEAIAQEVRALGADTSVFLPPMLEMAKNFTLLEKLKEQISCELKPSQDTVRRFWRQHPELFTPLAMKRVIEVTLTPLTTAPSPDQTVAELERALAEGGGESISPLVPSEPEAIIPDVAEITGKTSASVERSEEEPKHASGPTSPGAGESVTTSSDSLTTSTEHSTRATTESGGGAGPDKPAAGGIVPRSPRSESATKVYEPVSADTGAVLSRPDTWVSPIASRDEEPSGIEPAVKGRAKQIKPPVHARRITPTQLRDVVKNYRSADWQLAYRDLGFIYVEDHPELPRKQLAKIPVGQYLAPRFENGRAITYVIEDSRRPLKPPFEQIEANVYRVWREVEIEKKLDQVRKAELGKAAVNYRF